MNNILCVFTTVGIAWINETIQESDKIGILLKCFIGVTSRIIATLAIVKLLFNLGLTF